MRYVLESRRDEEYSEKKIIKIRPQIKNRQGGGQNHPPLGQPPNLKDVNIPRVKECSSTLFCNLTNVYVSLHLEVFFRVSMCLY